MTCIKELKNDIETARELLASTIQVKKNLLDPEITYISELLDNLLNEYMRLSRNMEK